MRQRAAEGCNSRSGSGGPRDARAGFVRTSRHAPHVPRLPARPVRAPWPRARPRRWRLALLRRRLALLLELPLVELEQLPLVVELEQPLVELEQLPPFVVVQLELELEQLVRRQQQLPLVVELVLVELQLVLRRRLRDLHDVRGAD